MHSNSFPITDEEVERFEPGVEPSTFVDTKVVKSVGWRQLYSPNVHFLNHFD